MQSGPSHTTFSLIPQNCQEHSLLNDGPVLQYQNKLISFILGCKLQEFCQNLTLYSWDYYAGIGTICTRKDISNLEDFVATLCKK